MDYCADCERIVEGNTESCEVCGTRYCPACGVDVTYLDEDAGSDR